MKQRYWLSLIFVLFLKCTTITNKNDSGYINNTKQEISESYQEDTTLYCITVKTSNTSEIECLTEFKNDYCDFRILFDTIQYGENNKKIALEESIRVIYHKTKDTFVININYMTNHIFFDIPNRNLFYQKRDLEEFLEGEDMARINIYKFAIDKGDNHERIASFTDNDLMKWNVGYMNRADGVAFWNKLLNNVESDKH